VLDHGDQLVVDWHFYPRLLPARFNLPEHPEQSIALDDPATLKENLTKLASAAFAVTLDGKSVALANPPDVTVAPDGGCDVTLIYRGRKNSHLQVRETILPLYPSSYIIDYQVYSPLAPVRGSIGYLMGGGPSPVIEYTQIGDDYRPSVFDWFNATPFKLFKSELRAAWINTSWLFLTLAVLLTRPARELYPLAWVMAMAWIIPIFLWAVRDAQIPLALHPIIPALVTAAIALICARWIPPFAGMIAILVVAALLNGCFEVQQTTLERPPPTPGNLTGLLLGLVASFALIFAAGLPIITECRKYPGFQRAWVPKICLGLALLALVVPWLS
jgi:hypothetical protein